MASRTALLIPSLAIALASSFLSSRVAPADLAPPPDPCDGKAKGGPCDSGGCVAETCSQRDYSKGTAPTSVEYECSKSRANLSVERVQVVLFAPHTNIGDLRVALTSPSGTTSLLADVRFDTTSGYNNYVFTSVRHWDEKARGQWTLNVSDRRAGSLGTFSSWQLKVYGAPAQCPCDWNGGPPSPNGRDVQDIFDFINDWFIGLGDFNSDGTTNTQDIFEFLNCWLTAPC